MKTAQVKVRTSAGWQNYGDPRAYIDARDLAAELITLGVIAAVVY
jgi:hypothetical protein